MVNSRLRRGDSDAADVFLVIFITFIVLGLLSLIYFCIKNRGQVCKKNVS